MVVNGQEVFGIGHLITSPPGPLSSKREGEFYIEEICIGVGQRTSERERI